MIQQLRDDLANVNAAIVSFERLEARQPRRGHQPHSTHSEFALSGEHGRRTARKSSAKQEEPAAPNGE